MRKWVNIIVLATTILLGGCSIEPPLYLRKAVATEVVVTTHVNVNVMWQVNWRAEWLYNWDVTTLGPLGYSDPSRMHLHIFTQGADGDPVSHTVHKFIGNSAEMDVYVGIHNLLFHNDDSEAHLFRSDSELSDIYCYTRNISTGLKASSPILTQKQKNEGKTKADELDEEPVALAPESLFTLYDTNRAITDNPDDYVYENGRYVLKIEGELNPATYIYLIQVKLLNNLGRVIGSNGGAAITGMAGGVDLMTRETYTSTVSVPMDVYMDKEQQMLGAKVITFGIPGCNPYDAASVAASESKHFYVLNVSYVNGSYRNVRVDISDQVRALPLGGVITLELDVNDFPPDENAGGDGGFNALIDDWEDEEGSTTITN